MDKKTMLLPVIGLMLLMASCSKAGDNKTPDDNGATVTAYVDIPDLRSMFTEPRVFLEEKDNGTDGVDIKWKEGENILVYTIFRQDDRLMPADRGLMSISKNTKKPGKFVGTFEIPIPDGIDRSRSFEMAGMIGTNQKFKADGSVQIDMSHNIGTNELPPMYFPFMDVENRGGKFTVYPYFELYGSILNLKITQNMFDPISVPTADITSDMMSSKGTLNIAAASHSVPPTWIPDTPEAEKRYSLNGGEYGVLGRNVNNSLLMWFKPLTPSRATTEGRLAIRLNSEVGGDVDDSIKKPTFKFKVKPFTEKKVYNMNLEMPIDESKGFIITEFNGERAGRMGFIELYNGTNSPLDFSKYYLMTVDGKDNTKLSTLQLGKTEGTTGAIDLAGTFNGADSQSTILGPGQTIIFIAENIFEVHKKTWGNTPPKSVGYRYKYYSLNTTMGYNNTRALKPQQYDFLALAKGHAENPDLNDIVDVILRGRGTPVNLMQDNVYRRKIERIYASQYDYYYDPADINNRNNTNWIYMGGSKTYHDIGYRFRLYRKNNTDGTTYSVVDGARVSEIPLFICTSSNFADNRYHARMYWNKDTAH